jgi:malate synthase
LNGKGASLLDGYMEDLATDRIYRLMLAQRLRHADKVTVLDANGRPVPHDAALLDRCFDEALALLVSELPLGRDAGNDATLTEASRQSRWMIDRGLFDPV